jgi:hypothetical protein
LFGLNSGVRSLTPFVMNISQASWDEYDLQMTYNELYKECMKLMKLYKFSLKKLKDVKHEKESLVSKLSESHALVDSLKFENTVLVENNKLLENELKDSKELSNRLSNDNLKNLFCVQKHVSDKPSMIVDNLGASTSHASNFEKKKSLFVKHVQIEEVKANIVCLDKGKNYCVNNYVKPKSKAHLWKQTEAKFVPTCHYCGIVRHIRPNCCKLKSQRPWNKNDASKKEKDVVVSSVSKYVPPHRRKHSHGFVPTCNALNLSLEIRKQKPPVST